MSSIRRSLVRPLVVVLLLLSGFLAAAPGQLAQGAQGAKSLKKSPKAPESATLLAPLVASEPFALPAADLLALGEKVAAADPAPDDAAVDLLLLEVVHQVGDDGRAVYRRREVYRLLTAEAVDVWGSVETGWTSWIQTEPTLDARVVTPAGREVRLDPATVVDGAADAGSGLVYSDQRHSRAPLPALDVGAVVELVVTVEDTRPMLPDGGTVRRTQLFSVEPARRVRLVVEGPTAAALQWHGMGGIDEPARETVLAPDRVRLTFDRVDQPAWEYVTGRPPEMPLGPTVDFSFGASWDGVARAYSAVVETQLAALDAAAPLLDGSGDSQWDQIAARLADLHRRLRYTSVALGDSGIVPRTPTETLERGYGDCKDLSLLLVASLRRAGVPAYVALLRAARGSDDVQPEVSGFGLFDHAIVYVPGAPALWIDPTDPYSPLGELSPQVEGRRALVASPDSQGLVEIPRSTSDANRITEVRTFEIVQVGRGRVTEESEGHGHLGRQLRAGWADLDPGAAADELGAYGRDNYLADEVVSAEVSALDPWEAPVRSRVELAESAQVVSDETQAVAVMAPGDLLVSLPGDLSWEREDDEEPRGIDYFLDSPHRVEHRYRLPIPPGFEVAELPTCPPREMGAATLDCTVEEVDGEVRVDLVFDTHGPRYTPAESEALRAAAAELDGTLLTLALDRTAARLARQGRHAEALAELRRLAALDPDDGVHLALSADTLLEVGLRDEAVAAARAATEIDPDSPFAWFQVGWAAMHDEVGRMLEDGFLREQAIAALRKARELEPDDPRTSLNLARALAWRADGQPHREGDDLDEAVEILEEIQSELEGTVFYNLADRFLFYGRRHDELLESLGDEMVTVEDWSFYLTARSLAGDTEAAVARAARQLGGRPQLAAAAGQAAAFLMLERAYDRGAQLMAEVEAQGVREPGLAGMRRILERIEPFRPDGAPADDPGRRVIDLFGRALLTENKEELTPFWTDEFDAYHDGAGEEFLGDFDEEMSSLSTIGGLSPTRELFADLITSLVVGDAQGDDETGYRVRFVFAPELGEEDPGIVYLAPRDGILELAATDSEPELLVTEAQRRLTRGHVDAARWWARQAVDTLESDEEGDESGSGLEAVVALLGEEVAAEGTERLAAALDLALALTRREAQDAAVVERWLDAPSSDDVGRALLAELADLYDEAHDPGRALDAWRRLDVEAADDPVEHRRREAELLHRSGRSAEAVAFLDRALGADETEEAGGERQPTAEEIPLALLRARILLDSGDAAAGLSALDRIATLPALGADTWRDMAWLALAAGRHDATTIEWAETALQRTDEVPSLETLRTAASAYAVAGRSGDAYRTLLDVLDGDDDDEVATPEEDDWWVLGRIAEELGLAETAVELYSRVSEPDADRFDSAWRLAQRGIERLAAGGGATASAD